jgi:hypothetical protein
LRDLVSRSRRRGMSYCRTNDQRAHHRECFQHWVSFHLEFNGHTRRQQDFRWIWGSARIVASG